MKIKFREYDDKKDFTPITIMEVPFSKEIIQDCFMYNSMDAPSELKIMLLEMVSKAFEEHILEGAPSHVDKEEVQKKFDKIEIRYKN